jgi:hypothetical protein
MEDAARYSTVEKLIHLGRSDWRYADLYFQAAEAALGPLCTRGQFRGLLAQRGLVKKLASDLRLAIQRGDWTSAEQVASEGAALRTQVERESRLATLAEKVYGKRSLDANNTALALSGALAQPARVLQAEIGRLIGELRTLAAHDASLRGFYERRAVEFDRMVVDLPEAPPPQIDPSELREAALLAADGADFAAVQRIARHARRTGRDRLGRVRAARPISERVARLADPLSPDAVERAGRLGLEAFELEPNDAFNAYLSCCCAERPVLPSFPLTEDRRQPETCTCGHACPPEIGTSLKSSLDALMVHPCLTSAGTRYLPWFGSEVVLVETFPEDDPDARSPLLEALSLPRRRGLARLAIEDALLSRGPQLCEELGLDPIAHRITCIPFDVYERLAGRHGWGKGQLWTHFDGYQVTRELHLQALVGGDIRFGGADDLCSVGRAYDSDHITARFAVVRRERFEARQAAEEK